MDFKKQIKVVGNLGQGHEAQNVHDPKGIAPTVREMHGKVTKIITNVFGQTNGISMPAKSQEGTTQQTISLKETSEQLTLLPYQNTTSSQQDFLANLSLLLGSGEDLKILGAHSSLKSYGSLGLREPHIYYLRTSKDSSPMMKGVHSKQSSERWMNLVSPGYSANLLSHPTY